MLSANPSDPRAPLTLAPPADGDPYQLWHQDHWRQFGNHKVTATLGMQDIDHVNKEAFVLINKGTKQMLSCGSHGEPMGLVDYAPGCDGTAVRKLILMETVRCLSIRPSNTCTVLGLHAVLSVVLYCVFDVLPFFSVFLLHLYTRRCLGGTYMCFV